MRMAGFKPPSLCDGGGMRKRDGGSKIKFERRIDFLGVLL